MFMIAASDTTEQVGRRLRADRLVRTSRIDALWQWSRAYEPLVSIKLTNPRLSFPKRLIGLVTCTSQVLTWRSSGPPSDLASPVIKGVVAEPRHSLLRC